MASIPLPLSSSIDPEEEAFKALRKTICIICRKHGITSKDDPRLLEIISKYQDRYPTLTAESIEDQISFINNGQQQQSITTSNGNNNDATESNYSSNYSSSAHNPQETVAHSQSTAPRNNLSCEMDILPAISMEPDDTDVYANSRSLIMAEENSYSQQQQQQVSRDLNNSTTNNYTTTTEEAGDATNSQKGCCFEFKSKCNENNGFNLFTYTLFLSCCALLMFLTSVLTTYLNYNLSPYRDWALAGGVTSTSAQFRVRGPSSDDGKRREFVVSTNPNLAIEADQILNVPVSYNSFAPEEHIMKRLSLDTLSPMTQYYYGITRPQRTANSAIVDGYVGSFSTPAPEGTRMDFTIATGACALTGSMADMFASVLDLNPLLFIHMGDLHYEDLKTVDIDDRLEAYDKVMGSPTQRLLYMRTIFAYMWDDHDWLGNNEDSNYDEVTSVAKQSYTLGIPHYELGSTSNEATAAKYQAFTIGTVRFILTDLRSESIRSTEYFSGRMYSNAQKDWFYNELSQAANYDFVVWVSTRPWTGPDEVGSDGWGGFASDRDELSAHIASTIGAGPRNLLVLSGDNHMVAFDDGSSTDYSGQKDYPGGFPLLHSGPLTNFGGGVHDFFNPDTNYFTDGCYAYNSELNYQFSTISFAFPSDESYTGCMLLRSYSKDSSNVIFEKELCGQVMRFGTSDQDTCELERLSMPTQYIFVAAAGLLVLNAILALWKLGWQRCSLALSYFGLGTVYYFITIAAAIAGAFCFSTLGVNMFAVSVFVLSQTAVGFLFICMAIVGHCNTPHADKNTMAETIKDSHDEEETSDKAIEEESVKSAENTELEDSYMRIVNPETAVASTLDPVDEDDAQQSDDAVANTIEPVGMDDDIQQRDVAMVPPIEPFENEGREGNDPTPSSAVDADASNTVDGALSFPVILQHSNPDPASSDVSSDEDENMEDYDPSSSPMRNMVDSNEPATPIDKMKIALVNSRASAPETAKADVEKNEAIIDRWGNGLDSIGVPVICGGENSYHDVKEGVAAVLTSAAGMKNLLTERVSSVLSRHKKTFFGKECYDTLEEKEEEGFEVGPGSI
ncbi:hypothetical protein ACHAWU_000995 [Discostella pseudostelligera]|uniref:PhoD-like phosphatase metallophosphatase domain-containing protein n=1 Tax=Discostella pseudostelligera TaxID=259834 RepID=A0ABD3MJ05_9STRA